MVIADHLEEIMTQEGSLADDDLRVLFKRIHGIDFQRAEREGFEERRSAIEDLFADAGIDIDLGDLEPGMSEAVIAAKIAEMAGSIQEKIKNEEDKMHRPGQGRTRQLAKEERMRQAEEVRSKSIASIYKQLAKALHPDLEPDDERRRRKVVAGLGNSRRDHFAPFWRDDPADVNLPAFGHELKQMPGDRAASQGARIGDFKQSLALFPELPCFLASRTGRFSRGPVSVVPRQRKRHFNRNLSRHGSASAFGELDHRILTAKGHILCIRQRYGVRNNSFPLLSKSTMDEGGASSATPLSFT